MPSLSAFQSLKSAFNGKATLSTRDDKPTSEALTIGVPAAIGGVLLICAMITLGVLYYRRYKKDKQENLADAQWAEQEDWDDEVPKPNNRPDYRPYDSSSVDQSRLAVLPNASPLSSAESIHGFQQPNSAYQLSTWDSPDGRRHDGTRV
ncbi:hypothetical protein N7488_010242 [Penicillium malachiteum]|nr:hypothetical protein N7488_010242 [Penicillium malachiteum]